MEAVEFLPLNAELRTYPLFFQAHQGCTGITWNVDTADRVKAGEVIGQFNFEQDGPPVAIVAPVDAIIIGTYTPGIASLPYPPSELIALLQPTGNPAQPPQEDNHGRS